MNTDVSNVAYSNSLIRLWFLYSIHCISSKIYVYTISYENVIQSKEEQIRKQEAEIARKTHEIQSSPSRRDPYILKATACTESFAGRRYAVMDLGEGPGPPRPYLG